MPTKKAQEGEKIPTTIKSPKPATIPILCNQLEYSIKNLVQHFWWGKF